MLPFWRQGAERSQSGIGGDDDDVSHILVACIIYPPLVVRRRIIGSIETNTLVSTQFLKLPRLDSGSGWWDSHSRALLEESVKHFPGTKKDLHEEYPSEYNYIIKTVVAGPAIAEPESEFTRMVLAVCCRDVLKVLESLYAIDVIPVIINDFVRPFQQTAPNNQQSLSLVSCI